VLEVVSKEPGGEYDEKLAIYAAMGVLYYTIYNPKHASRDQHEAFEVYKLEQGQYVRQLGNPVWMAELGLGIGHEVRYQEGAIRDWLYWYDEMGERYDAPEDALTQERLLRGQEQLIRRELEERLELEARSRRSFILRLLSRKFSSIDDLTLDRVDHLSIEQLESLGEELLDFASIDDLVTWLENHR
jgi:hypothetical protein